MSDSAANFGHQLPDQLPTIAAALSAQLALENDVASFLAERAALEREYAAKLQSLIRKYRDKKAKKDSGGLESLAKVLDHPLVGDLLAVGSLAAVAAIAESGANDPAKVKSATAVKTAGKAAAAAIGARLLKEMSSGGKKASAKS